MAKTIRNLGWSLTHRTTAAQAKTCSSRAVMSPTGRSFSLLPIQEKHPSPSRHSSLPHHPLSLPLSSPSFSSNPFSSFHARAHILHIPSCTFPHTDTQSAPVLVTNPQAYIPVTTGGFSMSKSGTPNSKHLFRALSSCHSPWIQVEFILPSTENPAGCLGTGG